MKTTILSRVALVATIAGLGLVYACNKSSNASQGSGTTTAADLQTSSDDQQQVSYESDALNNDATTALNGQASVSGSSVSPGEGSGRITTLDINHVDSVGGPTDTINNTLICDATISYADTSGARTITITYNGTNCAGSRTRSGTVTISIPNGVYWKQAGAAVTVNIKNLTITRLLDNKVIVINGTKTYTNVSGGLLIDLPNLTSITHTVTGSMSILFPNNTTRIWSEAKQRVWTYNDGYVVTSTGTHTDSLGNSNVAEYGTDRFGVSFESLISQPKVIAQSCEYRLTAGQNTVLRSDNLSATLTYGLDSSGDPTSCPGTGTYYYKLVIMKANGVLYTFILPY
jgi:hypothetical protein